MATRRLVVANQKGGVGKSTTAVSVAHGLALAGRRVLLVDLDPQASASLALGIEPAPATHRLLVAGDPLPQLVTQVRDNLDVLRSNDSLADARDLLGVKATRDARAALRTFTMAIEPYLAPYDFVLVDCAPALDILTLNALMLGQEVMVPISVDYLSAAGARQYLEALDNLRDLGGQAELRYVVPTFYNGRLNRAREMLGMLHRHFGELVTEPIRNNTRLAEAPHAGQTIFEYDNRAIGAEDYRRLVERVLSHDKA